MGGESSLSRERGRGREGRVSEGKGTSKRSPSSKFASTPLLHNP